MTTEGVSGGRERLPAGEAFLAVHIVARLAPTCANSSLDIQAHLQVAPGSQWRIEDGVKKRSLRVPIAALPYRHLSSLEPRHQQKGMHHLPTE